MMSEDSNQYASIVNTISQAAIDHFLAVAQRPTGVVWPSASPSGLPYDGQGTLPTWKEFEERFYPGMVASNGPNYYGFVTGGATVAAQMGDWLTTAFDQVVGPIHESSAVTVELETLHMLKELLRLDTSFQGSFVTGATMANFVNLAIARQWAGQQLGVNVAEEGLSSVADINIIASNPHSSIVKCLSLLGFGRKNRIAVATLKGREVIDPQALEAVLEQYGHQPCILLAGSGYVNSGDFDDLQALAQLKNRYNFWLHVDAAFGAYAALSDPHRHLLEGINAADSVTIDNHKWLNVPYDSAIQLSKHIDLQVEVFKNQGAAYLGNDFDNLNFIHLTPENSRRFRALPAWFTLKAYGRQGHREIITRNLDNAQALGAWVTASPDFTLVYPVYSNIVCFTLARESDQEKIPIILQEMTRQGATAFTPTQVGNTTAFRAAFCNWRTERKHVESAWNKLNEVYRDVVNAPEKIYQTMKIENSTSKDIPKIFSLYQTATDFQKIKFPEVHWPTFDQKLIESEVHANRQWKLMIDNQMACIWATTFDDPQIWEERNTEPSVYIHRIATHPNFRKRNLVTNIVTWAKGYAKLHNKKFIRMDTVGDNKKLRAHYEKCGFQFLGLSKLKNTAGLPAHYDNATVSLFEIALE